MRVLLSAFSCAPNYGSEPGVGWHWAVEIARLDHSVVALTNTMWQAEIEAEIERGSLPRGLTFDFFMPRWLQRARDFGWRLGAKGDAMAGPLQGLTEHLVHLVWQFLALGYVRRRYRGDRFDIVHHITYGGIRHPTRLGNLPYPLVLGPLGGGERAPFVLRRGLPWRPWLGDLVRDLHTWIIRFDPITVGACRSALVIYVKTRQSKTALPERFHAKTVVEMEIGTLRRVVPPRPERRPGQQLRLLYCGRFLHWKGLDLGLKALAHARERGLDVTLSIAGRGPAGAGWQALSSRLGIDDAVSWLGWVPFEQMPELYRSHDALLFPSLHDSSGNAVLESLTAGLPVICLDLGGPGTIIDDTCGRVVSSEVASPDQCIRAIADAIEQLCRSPELCASLSAGARRRAEDFEWPKPVIRVYRDIERRLQRGEAAPDLAAE